MPILVLGDKSRIDYLFTKPPHKEDIRGRHSRTIAYVHTTDESQRLDAHNHSTCARAIDGFCIVHPFLDLKRLR